MSVVLRTGPRMWGRNSWPNSGHLPLSLWSWRPPLPTNGACSRKITVGHHWVWTPQCPVFQGNKYSYACYHVILPPKTIYCKTLLHIDWWVGGLHVFTSTKLRHLNLGLYSLSGKTSYRKISWSLEAARFGIKLFQLLWNLAGTSAALLPRCLSNFRAIRPLQHQISRLRDFTRFGGKTSYRLVNRGPEGGWTRCLKTANDPAMA